MERKSTRQMKVYYGYDAKGKKVSQIRMRGEWLAQIGFAAGIPFTIKCEEGRLILETCGGKEQSGS